MSSNRLIIAIAIILLAGNMSAKDHYLYSYQAKLVEFTCQPLTALLDSIIWHELNISGSSSCQCVNDSIAVNVTFSKTSNWPNDRRVVIEVYTDKNEIYRYRDVKYVSYLDVEGKRYRINVDMCCEEDANWCVFASSVFFDIKDYIVQYKYERNYKDVKEMFEKGCMVEDDGGTDMWFVYEDGIIMYWRGRFCDGSMIMP